MRDFDDYFDGSNDRRTRRLPCSDLRTKMCDGEPDGDGLDYYGDTPTSIFWCLKTMKPFGPDGLPCEPRACGRERACCDPPKQLKLG